MSEYDEQAEGEATNPTDEEATTESEVEEVDGEEAGATEALAKKVKELYISY